MLSREIYHNMVSDIETHCHITNVIHHYNHSGMLGWKEGGSLFPSSVVNWKLCTFAEIDIFVELLEEQMS